MSDNSALDNAAISEFVSEMPGKAICIHGSDDDEAVVMVFNDGDRISEEVFNVPRYDPARFRLTENESVGLDIVLCQLDTGVWSAGFAQLREGAEMPTWPISFGAFDNMTVMMVSVPSTVTFEPVS